MNIISHGIIGWTLGQQAAIEKREAVIFTAASILPDIDAIGIVADLFNGGEAKFFSAWHHKFGHNIFFGVFISIVAALISSRKVRTAFLSLLFFHIHLFCDLVGARGPDGYQWPLYYWFPYSETGYVWPGQWEINAWPNIAITTFFIFLCLWQIAKYGYSPFKFISLRVDKLLVETISKRLKKAEPENEQKN